MSSNLNTRTAAVALPLPEHQYPVELFVSIMNGGDGELQGFELWHLVRLVEHLKEMPLARPDHTSSYNAWLLYLSDENGNVTPYEIRSAEKCDATMIRKIVGYGVTCPKDYWGEELKLPTPSELAERFWL